MGFNPASAACAYALTWQSFADLNWMMTEMLISQTNVTDLEVFRKLGARVSFSQAAEDLIVTMLTQKENGFYVDVGCHDPYRYSNTALLYLYRNWSGINIDADARAIAKFNAERPRDININCGVSDERGEMEFTMFKAGNHNSFDAGMVANAVARTAITGKIHVAVRPLCDILDEYLPAGQVIDYMNIDCEGLDAKVIAGNDWKKYAPRVLTAEIHGLNLANTGDHPVIRFLTAEGYKFRAHCISTSVFVRA